MQRYGFPLLIAFLVGSAHAQEPAWKKHVIHQGAQTMTAVAADFTGDGLPDVISDSDNKTRLFVAPDWNEIILDDHPDIRSYIHSEVFDVDSDGDLDYIGARYNPGLIVWLEQPDDPLGGRWKRRIADDSVRTNVASIHQDHATRRAHACRRFVWTIG